MLPQTQLVSANRDEVLHYLDTLNAHQIEAVNIGAGLSCVLGNPGSGKTRTIVGRIARMAVDGLDPDCVLAMTFTRAAAYQMNERLTSLGVHGARVGTIHSLSRQIVATETDLFAHGRFDSEGRLPLELKKVIKSMRISGQLRDCDVDLEGVTRFIEACKAQGLCYVSADPFGVNIRAEAAIRKRARSWWTKSGVDPNTLLTIYLELERSRGTCRLYDFDDMQLWAWLTLLTNEEARLRWRNRWSVVIVDEAQDSTPVQWDLARFLVGLESCIGDVKSMLNPPQRDEHHHSLMVAGQPEQCLDLDTPIEVLQEDRSSEMLPICNVDVGMQVACSIGGKKYFAPVLAAKTHIRKYHAKLTLEDKRQIDGTIDHLIFGAIPDRAPCFYSVVYCTNRNTWTLGILEPQRPMAPELAEHENIKDMWIISAHDDAAQAQFTIEMLEGATKDGVLLQAGVNSSRPLLRTVRDDAQEIVIIVGIGGLSLTETPEAYVTARSPLLSVEHLAKAIGAHVSVIEGQVVGHTFRRFESGAAAYSFAMRIARQLESSGITADAIRIVTTLIDVEGMQAIPLGQLAAGLTVHTEMGPKQIVQHARYAGNKAVRDLEISMATNFFADGIASHNSIYAWRAADPQIFVDYAKDPEVKTVSLPLNYRSNKAICDLGSQLITGRPWALTGTILPALEKHVPKDAVTVKVYKTAEEEAEMTVHSCLERAVDGGLRTCAVLSRLRVALDLVEVACIQKRIKYIKMASGSIFDSREVKDILGYVRVASGLDPEGRWLYHIINRPFRYIGKPFLTKCSAAATQMNVSLLDAIKYNESDLNYKQRRAVRELYALLVQLNEMVCQIQKDSSKEPEDGKIADPNDYKAVTPADLILTVLKETDYIAELKREEGLLSMDESKISMLAFLVRMAGMFRDVGEFIAYIDKLAIAVRQAAKSGLRLNEESRDDALVLSTVHRFKGLESRHIYIVDVVQGHFPCAKSDNPDEELRLAYVAATRAMETCTLSYSVQNSIGDVDNLERTVQDQTRLASIESSFVRSVRAFLEESKSGQNATK